jgi:hypothetical protein
MRRVMVILFLATTVSALAQKQSIGLRIGNPLGLTYKRYLPNDRAFEFGIGTAPGGWNKNYYENSFSDFDRYDDFRYRSHAVNSTVYLQGRYLFQYDIPIEGMVGKLGWYWGAGAMLKFATVKYTYQENDAPGPNATDTRTDIDFGPEGIAGMEYTFDDIPLTVFGDVSLLLEFADRPFTFRAFAAAGARFNF